MGRSTTAAHRLQDAVSGVALGGDHAKELRKVVKVLARPPLASSIDHLIILTRPSPNTVKDGTIGHTIAPSWPPPTSCLLSL
jgi:hypothetical protein